MGTFLMICVGFCVGVFLGIINGEGAAYRKYATTKEILEQQNADILERNKILSDKDEALKNQQKTLLEQQRTISEQESKILANDNKLAQKDDELSRQQDKIEEQLSKITQNQTKLSNQNKQLQALQTKNQKLTELIGKEEQLASNIDTMKNEISELAQKSEVMQAHVKELMRVDDLYSRIYELIDYGHYETPKYMHETSDRFNEEIKIIRNNQKKMITDKTAIIAPENNLISEFTKLDKQVAENSKKLMLRTFNIECDFLIERVSASNFAKTLEQINKKASDIEKEALSLEIGFNLAYVNLKMKECELVYQYKLKKQAEQEEQQLIKEQMKEEIRLAKEYEKAQNDAKREEEIYRKALEKAKQELAVQKDKEAALARIAILEQQLQEAIENSQRAQSMAQQTKKGYIYVISNIGSFGENVYKIGLTRRLDPMERVRELGDASVPFSFDVHCFIYCENAPETETALHRYFSHKRVNAVNFRKEFFRVSIDEIKQALNEIVGADKYELKTTIAAEQYFESRRLRG